MTLPKTKEEHFANVAELRCVVSNSTEVTIHHCHGGSLKEHGWHVGMGQRQNHALVIPLHPHFHTGAQGADVIGIQTWEARYGPQVEYLNRVNRQLPYDIWELAELWRPKGY